MRKPPQRSGGSLPGPWAVTGIVGLLCLAGMGFVLTRVLQDEGPPGGSGAASLGRYVQLGATPAPSPPPPVDLRRVARRLDPELMEHAPPEGAPFLEGIKNPCWNVPDGAGGAVMRCLPYWYIGGSFQAGAESLYMKLQEHPDVLTNEGTRWQFWAEENKPLSGYLKHMNKSHKAILEDPQHKVIVDASASTFAFYWSASLRTHRAFQRVMVPCWRECSEGAKGNDAERDDCMGRNCYPRAIEADRKVAAELGVPYEDLQIPLLMKALYGPRPPKLVFLLRNPTERLHSAYWGYAHYHGKYGKTAQGFLAYLKEQIGELKACETRPGPGRTPEGCALWFEALGKSEEKLFFHADQIMRGMYALYLEHWLRHFPRENILVIKSEHYFADPAPIVQQVYEFLGLQPPSDPKLQQAIASAGKPNDKDNPREAMLPEAKELVLSFYKPWNEKLAKLLNDEYFLTWNNA